ncbi:MAG: hypothetical protein WCA19_00910 [Candidatus Acidiferrales bacterium]
MNIVQIVGLFGILYMLFMVRGQLQAILECLQGSGAGGPGEALWDKLDAVSDKLDSVNKGLQELDTMTDRLDGVNTNLQGLKMIENELRDFRQDVANWIRVYGKDSEKK